MPAVDDQQIYRVLQELGVLDQRQLDLAWTAGKNQGISFREALLKHDLIQDDQLGEVIADILAVPFVQLSTISIPDNVLQIIPEVVAKAHRAIAFRQDTQGLHIAMDDPSNGQLRTFLEKKIGIPVIVHYATERDIADALALYTKDVKQAFDAIIVENVQQARGKTAEPPIIKMVETIITHAHQNKTSDIHIEPMDQYSLVRFRIDGMMHDIVRLPAPLHPQIVTRVKVLSRLRTDQHQAAQDGKIRFKVDGEDVDIRVSIVPTTGGENIVMRLLSEASRRFSLLDLGFTANDFAKVEAARKKPYGMILATGPTGSGKTTTLYAILKLLNRRDVNIMTIEDPVEYSIEGVNQIQVNPKTNLTFASGLRSIVRQDPDIILVGEIRDEETAGIAINSAMTGHLVLSTFHTNDAPTAIPRLFDMGVEPYLIASTVNIIIAQRLVRKICSKCRVSYEGDPQELCKTFSAPMIQKHFGTENIRMYRGKGCAVCHQSGYVGRIGIFEVMVIDAVLRKAIMARQDASELRKLAVSAGMTVMAEDGFEKVKVGMTTIEEILRVTKE